MEITADRQVIGLGKATCFAGLARTVDTCALIRLQNRFVSFISGTTTSIGVALGQGKDAAAGRAGNRRVAAALAEHR